MRDLQLREDKYAKEKIMITKNGFTAAEQSVPIQPQAYFREAGSGTSVVCIHSSASSSGQWRALMERLADQFRVIAVDLYGSGKTAAWPQDQPMHLDDEVARLSSVFWAAGDRFHLIGRRLSWIALTTGSVAECSWIEPRPLGYRKKALTCGFASK
jgi:hypothetical protein